MKFENITGEAHLVEDWEFQFAGGASIVITVDSTLGDTYKFDPVSPTAYFKLTEKDSPVDPDGTMPEEEIFIPMSNVLCIRKAKRMQDPPSVEQKEEWQNLLREMTNSPKFGN